jgi:hypothetical protein
MRASIKVAGNVACHTQPYEMHNIKDIQINFSENIKMRPGSNPVGTRFFTHPDRPWGPPSLLYNGYRVFPGGKVRPGRAADHSSPSSAAGMEE